MIISFGKILFKISSNHAEFSRSLCRIIKSYKKQCPKKLYSITKPCSQDYQNIIKLIHKYYYPEEPTAVGAGVCPNPILDARMSYLLTEGLSLVAKCRYSGRLLGVALNETSKPWDASLTDKFACRLECPKLKNLLHFYAYLQRAPNIFECYGVQEVLEISYVAVKKEERRHGLAMLLAESAIRRAEEDKYRIVRVDATNHYTARICEKLGMKKIYELPYEKYLACDNKPVIVTNPPHNSVKVYIIQLPRNKSKM